MRSINILKLFAYGLTTYAFLSSLNIHAQDNQLSSPDTIPFTLTDHNNISIQAILNSKDTVDLMFHTAASSVTITEAASETLHHIQWDAQDEVNSWGGNSSARYSKSNTLDIQSLTWDSLTIWETKNSGPGTDGKFGPDLFSGYVIELNFNKHILVLHKTLPEHTKTYVKTPLIFEDDFMFIEGISHINGTEYKNKFLIHSGYGGSILFDDKFVAESNIGKHIEIIDEQELKDSYGNVLKTKKGKLPQFSIADINFEYIPVGFFEGTIGRQHMSVIGGDLLKRFNIIIDADRTSIYLNPNSLSGNGYAKI